MFSFSKFESVKSKSDKKWNSTKIKKYAIFHKFDIKRHVKSIILI